MSASAPAPPPSRAAAEAALRSRWGHAAFREGQWEAIEAVLDGRDTLAVLPTGGGKSVLYQVPAVLTGRLVLVVSPLVALMQDQVEALARRGIPAAALHAGLSARALDQAWTDAEFGRYRLLYVTPERLVSDVFVARAARLPVALLAVDEAHCISEWGHDFRPAYRRIAEARAHLDAARARAVPVLAVTATATPPVRRDIAEQLALRSATVVVRGFDRPNIVWSVFRTEDKARKLLEIARSVPGGGLVYAGTRRGAEAWAAVLAGAGVAAEAYHAGLPAPVREVVQQRWTDGRTRFVSATSAFGMGIDRADVRAVVHVELPPTLEAYYQEAGRAGRDGRRAWAVLLFGDGDADLPRALAADAHPNAAAVQAVYDAAASLAGLALGAEAEGPVRLDTDRIARAAGVSAGTVRAALALVERAGAWRVLPDTAHAALVRFCLGPEAVRAWAAGRTNRALAAFAEALLRTLPAEAFAAWAEADLRALERRTGLDRERVLRGLAFLAGQRVLDVLPPGDGVRIAFAGPRATRLHLDAAALARGRRRAEGHLADMLGYVRTSACRRRYLLAYFGEAAPERCGRCDVCLGRHRPPEVTPADEPLLERILDAVARGTPRTDWLADIPAHRRDALADWLVAEGLLRIPDPLADAYALTPKALRLRRR